MTQDEIIRIFHEAGELAGWKPGVGNPLVINYLTHFAALVAAHEREKLAEQEPFDMDDHPPHRLCECRKCMEYFTPLPDCDAFAASGKPIAEQEPVGEVVSSHQAGLYDELPIGTKLYAAPVRTKDLTDEEIMKVTKGIDPENYTLGCARAVIAADRELNK